MDQHLEEMRRRYSLQTLDVKDVARNPIDQFRKWFDEATKSEIIEPNAMTLATVTEKGIPSSRMVLLKGIEQGGFVFYTNYQSEKGKDLEVNPVAALNFFWGELERQVRITGSVTTLSEGVSEAYFQSRPRESQIGAWVSPQSTPIKSRAILEERIKAIETRFKDQKVLPKPKQWGGYLVKPMIMEFWQGRPGRLHDRIQYLQKSEGVWDIRRLAP